MLIVAMYQFTAKAQKVFSIAKDYSISLKNKYIGTEHLFIGLMELSNGVTANILNKLGVEKKRLMIMLKGILEEEEMPDWNDIIITPRTSKVLEMAFKDAQRQGDSEIDEEHLLLSILKEGEGLAVRLLLELKVDIDEMIEEAKKISSFVSTQTMMGRLYPNTPLLNKIGKDITYLAKQGKIEPLFGHEKELHNITQSLMNGQNPVLIGPEGVGKSRLVNGLAMSIVRSEVPLSLSGKRIIEFNLPVIIKDYKTVAKLEDDILEILNEMKQGDVIVFFPDIVSLIKSPKSINKISQTIIDELLTGDIQFIATAIEHQHNTNAGERLPLHTFGELEEIISPIYVDELSAQATADIIKRLSKDYEKFYGIYITDKAINKAIELSQKYITNKLLPDKAIDLVERTIPQIKSRSLSGLFFLEDGQERTALGLKIGSTINESDILSSLSELINVPVIKLISEEKDRIKKLHLYLQEKVLCQEQAIKDIISVLEEEKENEHRPRGIFFFFGPPGVGKTETARRLAEFLFGNESMMIRTDKSSYKQDFSVARYVAGATSNSYTEDFLKAVKEKPYSVILVENIEKAYIGLINTLTELANNKPVYNLSNEIIDFHNTIVIFTSKKINDMFFNTPLDGENLKKNIRRELLNIIPERLVQAIDKIVLFNSLTKEDTEHIVKSILKGIPFKLEFDESVVNLIMKKGYSANKGAYLYRKVVEDEIISLLAQKNLEGKFSTDDTIRIKVDKEKFAFEKVMQI